MHRLVLAALIAAIASVAATPALAQGRFVFDIDSPQSSFTFSGSVAIGALGGPIVGQPPTFNPAGAAELDMTVLGGSLSTAQMVAGSSAVTVPTLNAIVPAPFPFLPPLATVTVTSSQVVFTSVDPITLAPAQFSVGTGGAFTTSVVATLLSGTATATGALIGTQVIPLAGLQSTPQTASGTITPEPNGFRIAVPVNVTFNFNDPATGVSGTLQMSGTLGGRDRAFATDVGSISLATGGSQNQTLSAGSAHAGEVYLVLASASGTTPGVTLLGVPVPLNFDGLLVQSAVGPNTPPFMSTLGTLGPLGVGSAAFVLPPLVLPALVGVPLDFAYVTISGPAVTFASNAVPFVFAP